MEKVSDGSWGRLWPPDRSDVPARRPAALLTQVGAGRYQVPSLTAVLEAVALHPPAFVVGGVPRTPS